MGVMAVFEITDVHDEAAVAELRERLVSFNIAATGYGEYRSMSCFLRNDEGELDAGIDGFSWGGYAMVEWLWVAASLRGSQLGTGLLRSFEAEAQKRGCRAVRVNTHTAFRLQTSIVILATKKLGTPKTPHSITENTSW
jgi:GNAT superfamily N-acetyltransferase